MKFFSFDWLKSDERKELNKLREEKLKKEIKEEIIQEQIAQIPVQYSPVKPYSKLFLVNDIITIVFNDGSPYSRSGVDKSFADRVRECTTEGEIFALLQPKIESKKEEELVQEIDEPDLSILKEDSRFIVEGKRVFFKGINLEIPSIIVVSFIEALEKGLLEEFTSLKYFWMWTALNPIESSRKDLYSFIQKNDIKITTNGLLEMYRRVVSTGNENKALVTFISEQYYKVKKWKKSPKNYEIFDDGGLVLQKVGENKGTNNWKGNLEDLYLNLPSMMENTFTDAHTRSKEIKVGQVYKEDEDKINLDNNVSCGAGLHVGGPSFGFSGFGDIGVVALVNPMFVRSVPNHECSKMRVSEMFIAGVLELDEYQEHIESDDVNDYSEIYFNQSVEELEKMLEEKKFDVLTCQENVPVISVIDIKSIKNLLKSRVISID